MIGDALVVARAPLRITLGGGGTDLPLYSSRFGGDVLTAAISVSVTVVASTGSVDGTFRYGYEQTWTARTAAGMGHAYVREGLKLTGTTSPCQIASLGPVPSGTGLGSSGAFSVTLVAALNALAGRRLPRTALIEQACELEIERLGMPVGKQDHYACGLGGLRRLVIDTSGRVHDAGIAAAPDTIARLERSLLLFYTGRRRDSATQLHRTAGTAAMSQRIEQLHHIRTLGDRTRAALERGDLAQIPELLAEHWRFKRGRESTRWDEYLLLACRHGAKAGKIVGAGGGGFLLIFAEPAERGSVIDALCGAGLPHVPFRFSDEGLTVHEVNERHLSAAAAGA